MYINDLVHLFQLVTPAEGVVSLQAAADFFIEKAALNWEKVEPATYGFDMPTADKNVTQHVQLGVLKPIVLFDPCKETEENKKTLRRFHDDYLAEKEKDFLHSEYEVDNARIWPRFHLINEGYIAFTRFGYIRDRIGNKEEKQGYRLEFLSDAKLGQGGYGTVNETVTIIPEGDDSTRLHYKNNQRCVKSARLDETLEFPFTEIDILDRLPYADYKKKDAILCVQYGVKMLLIPQKRHAGMALSTFLGTYLLDTQSALEITALMMEQVDYLNALGILHRDIKPGNIIYNPHTNTLRLVDFGLAAFVHDRFKLVKNAGTRYFMAPETQVKQPHYSYESDVYATTLTMRRIFNFFPREDIENFNSKSWLTEESYAHFQDIRISYFNDYVCDLSHAHHALLVTTYKEGTHYLHDKRTSLTEMRQSIANILESMQPDYPQKIARELNEKLKRNIADPKTGKTNILNMCKHIRCDADSIKTFIDTLSLDFLKQCTSMHDIRKSLHDLIDAHEDFMPSLPDKNARLTRCIAKLEEKIKKKSSSSAIIQHAIHHLRKIKELIENPKTLAKWQQLVINYREQAISDIALLATTYLVDQISTSQPLSLFARYRGTGHQPAYACLQILCSDQKDSDKLDALYAYAQTRPNKEKEEFIQALDFPTMPALARWIDNKKLELSTHCITYRF